MEQLRHDQFNSDETIKKFNAINDEPKQISFYLFGSLMQAKEPNLLHSYFEKIFKKTFSIGYHTEKDEDKNEYLKIHESDDYGSTVIWVNDNEARIQLER